MKINMAFYFIPLLIIVLAGGYLVVRASQRKWDEGTLSSGEKIVYEQVKIDLQSARAENFNRITKGLFLRATNKRFFFLLPNKKNIFLILDFTTPTENTVKENVDKGIIYVDKKTMKIVEEKNRKFLQVEGKNFMGVNIHYTFEVKEPEKIHIEN